MPSGSRSFEVATIFASHENDVLVYGLFGRSASPRKYPWQAFVGSDDTASSNTPDWLGIAALTLRTWKNQSVMQGSFDPSHGGKDELNESAKGSPS